MGAYDRDSRAFKIIDRQLTERFAFLVQQSGEVSFARRWR
jgi:hypothetical protein